MGKVDIFFSKMNHLNNFSFLPTNNKMMMMMMKFNDTSPTNNILECLLPEAKA